MNCSIALTRLLIAGTHSIRLVIPYFLFKCAYYLSKTPIVCITRGHDVVIEMNLHDAIIGMFALHSACNDADM